MKIRITQRELAREPISGLLYGNFVEFGYGQQLEAMGVEMLFNRSFEAVPPYTESCNGCYFLYFDENDCAKGYEKDWSAFDWHHSAYRHDAWHVAPAPIPTGLISDENTYFVCASPFRKAKLELLPGGLHGTQYARLDNSAESRGSGLAQAGVYVREGREYLFSGYISCAEGAGRAELALHPEGEYSQACASAKIDGIGGEWRKYSVVLKSGHTGFAVFAVWAEPGAVLDFDGFSLTDADNFHGWRSDVVQILKDEIRPAVMRWPGGCFASFHDFADGIGEERIPRPSYFWGGLISNDLGSAEMGVLCREIGAQQLVCLNLHHPAKAEHENWANEKYRHKHGYRLPQFADEKAGIENALRWADYLNGGDDTEMGALRRRHGCPEPFRAAYWEMDNEAFRWFGWEEYAHACVRYSRALKAAYPYIKTGMISYDNFDKPLERMLGIAGKDIDFLADRGVTRENLDRKLGAIREYNRENGTHIQYCNTEWLPYDLIACAPGEPAIKGSPSYAYTKWRYALNIFKQFMLWRREDDILFVNFNNLANTHGHNVMEIPKDGAFLSAAGEAMAMLRNSPARRALAAEGYEPSLWDDVQAQAYWDLDRENLVLCALNAAGAPRRFDFDVGLLGRRFGAAEIRMLHADGPMAMNRQSNAGIKRFHASERGDFSVCFSVEAPEWSFVEIVLSANGG